MPIDPFTFTATAIAGIDAASNLVKKLMGKDKVSTTDLEEVHNVIRKTHGDILETRIKQGEVLLENEGLQKKVATLQDEIKSLKKWGIKKDDYKLVAISPGVEIFIKKGGDKYDKWYCPTCFQRKLLTNIAMAQIHTCTRCNKLIVVEYKCPTCTCKVLVETSIHRKKVEYFKENHL